MPTLRFGRALFYAGCAALLVAVFYVARIFFSPSDLKSAAASMVRAISKGDERGLWQAASGPERACSELDPGRLKRAWEILVQPRVSRSKLVREEAPRAGWNPTQASGRTWFTDPSGNLWSIVVVANQAEDGAKTQVVFTMLVVASGVDEKGNALPGSTAQSLLDGVRKFRFQLESIGIKKILLAPRNCVSWDDLEARLVKSIELEHERKLSGQEPNPKSK